jgi:AcrR family transcriptional regulator
MSMTEGRAKARTRRAILDAAVAALAQDPSASLGTVAAAAGVGRTTLHRYFPERSDLLEALSVHTLELVAVATERAALAHGPAPEALGRLCREYFELGDALTLIFNDPQITTRASWQEECEHDRALFALVARGRDEGTIDPAMRAEWIQYSLWALLYSACTLMREQGVPRHEALELCRASLTKLVAAQ